jgi:hypothetical protein
MNKTWVIALGIAAGAVGCASSGEIQNGAYEHQQRADLYRANGDYSAAAREQRAADKQFAKSQRRAYEEAYNRVYWW